MIEKPHPLTCTGRLLGGDSVSPKGKILTMPLHEGRETERGRGRGSHTIGDTAAMTIGMTDSVAVRSEVKGSGRRDVEVVPTRIGKEGKRREVSHTYSIGASYVGCALFGPEDWVCV